MISYSLKDEKLAGSQIRTNLEGYFFKCGMNCSGSPVEPQGLIEMLPLPGINGWDFEVFCWSHRAESNRRHPHYE